MSDGQSDVIGGLAVGVSMSLHPEFAVASLRHFDGGQSFTAALVSALGSADAVVPEPLRAAVVGAAATPTAILARRSMTETLLLCGSEEMAAVEEAVAARPDVAVVNQTGGIRVWQLTGTRVPDLLMRLGSVTAMPELGQALTGRLGEVSAMTLCVVPGEVLLLADRAYGEHLSGWVRQTAADF